MSRAWLLVPLLVLGCRAVDTPTSIPEPVASGPATTAASESPTEDPESVVPVDEEALREVHRRSLEALSGEFETWVRTPFDDQASAVEAFGRLLPSSPRTVQRVSEQAESMGLDAGDVRAFVDVHPDVAERLDAEFDVEGVVSALLSGPEARAQRERIVELSPGPLAESLAAMSPEQREATVRWMPSMAPPSGQLVGWHRSSGLEDLLARVSEAAAERREVAIYVRASWAAPAVQMETTVLGDPEVRGVMAEHQRIIVDLTEDDDESEAVLSRLGLMVVPTLMLCPNARALDAALRSTKARTPRSLVLIGGVRATGELLELIR